MRVRATKGSMSLVDQSRSHASRSGHSQTETGAPLATTLQSSDEKDTDENHVETVDAVLEVVHVQRFIRAEENLATLSVEAAALSGATYLAGRRAAGVDADVLRMLEVDPHAPAHDLGGRDEDHRHPAEEEHEAMQQVDQQASCEVVVSALARRGASDESVIGVQPVHSHTTNIATDLAERFFGGCSASSRFGFSFLDKRPVCCS